MTGFYMICNTGLKQVKLNISRCISENIIFEFYRQYKPLHYFSFSEAAAGGVL